VPDQKALEPAPWRFECDAEHPWRPLRDDLPGEEPVPDLSDTAEFPCAEFPEGCPDGAPTRDPAADDA
jgi:hypothetical protein